MEPESKIELGRMLRWQPADTDTLPPLYSTEEEPHEDELPWPKSNPFVGTGSISLEGEATFRGRTIINPDACRQFEDLRDRIRVTMRCAAGVFIKAMKKVRRNLRLWFYALPEASPRVRHLARHARKSRTRKKNENRALREYELRRKRQNDRT